MSERPGSPSGQGATIEAVHLHKLSADLTLPTKTPLGVLDAVHSVFVKIETGSGIVGWGEAAPFAPITGDSQESSFATGRRFGSWLKGKDATAVEARMRELNTLTVGEPSIRSAFDMALHDIAAKTAGLPLYRYLGGEQRRIRTDFTVGMQPTLQDTAGRVQGLVERGFDAIKLKVGRPEFEDVEHVRVAREAAGDERTLRIDANQGWDLPTAVANLDAMALLNVQYCEQPLRYWNLEGLAELRGRVNVPICADESVFGAPDALQLIRRNAADYLNIKLGKSGGVATACRINAIAEAAQKRCMIGCFGETRLGLTAAAHLAMARPNIVFQDLDSAYKLKTDPIQGGMQYDDSVGGLLHLTERPGLGLEVDETFLSDGVAV